jgi:hypothetical protein
MTMPDNKLKRYTLLRRADDERREASSPAGRPGVRRLTLVRRAQLWPPMPRGDPPAPRR